MFIFRHLQLTMMKVYYSNTSIFIIFYYLLLNLNQIFQVWAEIKPVIMTVSI